MAFDTETDFNNNAPNNKIAGDEPSTSSPSEFDALAVLYRNYHGVANFELVGEIIGVQRGQEIPIGARALPSNDAGLFFAVGFFENAPLDTVEKQKLRPSATIYHQARNDLILIWVLPEPDQGAVENLPDIFRMDLNVGIPLPGDDGWEWRACDEDTYTATEIIAAKARQDTDVPAEKAEAEAAQSDIDDSRSFYNAEILRPFNPEDYQQPITVMWGKNRKEENWIPIQTTVASLLATMCRHEVGPKDGGAYVFADMVPGPRKKDAVRMVTAIGLDYDTAISSSVIDGRITKLGFTAARYTTHSHMKRESKFKRDVVRKFDPDADIDSELMRRFVREEKRWEQSIADSVEFLLEEHTSDGIFVMITHKPMPKHRVVIPLAVPFNIATEGKFQRDAHEKWEKIVSATGDRIGLPYDKACLIASHLFYTPRHDEGCSYENRIWGGPLYDWRTVQSDDPTDKRKASKDRNKPKSVTPEGRELGRWSHRCADRFQAAYFIEDNCEDRIRGSASSGGFSIECPFDEDHGDAGNANSTSCFVVNASEGKGELFTIACRHDHCRDKTMLDMLGNARKTCPP